MDASLIAHAVRMIQDAVCSSAVVETQAGPAAVIILADPMPLWLFPALFLAGMLSQTAGLFLHRRSALISGAVLTAAALDRDLTLAVGQILATAGLLYCGGRPS